jgi:hypothetical protein
MPLEREAAVDLLADEPERPSRQVEKIKQRV